MNAPLRGSFLNYVITMLAIFDQLINLDWFHYGTQVFLDTILLSNYVSKYPNLLTSFRNDL